jgi:hypothetical protein
MTEQGHHGADLERAGHSAPGVLPTILGAPEAVAVWRTRAAIVAIVFGLISLVFLFVPGGRGHLLRAYLMGYMTIFNFCGGALAFLMVQYVSGGKWGQILRRPLEAMTRTIWMLVVMVLPILLLGKHLYQWMAFPTAQDKLNAYHNGFMTHEQQLTAQTKVAMLNPGAAWLQAALVLGYMAVMIVLLNKWSLQRDADPRAGSVASFDYWRIRFENLSGPGILFYVIAMTDFVIVFVKSLDVTWYSSVYGLQFLVAQGYAVLALGVLSLILLSRYEPMRSMFRTTEQHDMGKLMFAFVMLNIYLTFAEFLIIWSGNLPDEMPWYLNRIHGGWWVVCSMDAICHWVIPFCILLSRDIKRSKAKMIWVCCFMIFARMIDMWWLIEPNFKDAAGNLHILGNFGILAYATVPVSIIALWVVYYLTELMKRPLINVNDPHTAELLEPEHAH